ncbi:MAG: exonuclease domain-containing protein [Hydrogenophaga sp.]|uniref:3'-5' exonuclease n=1 Tax=Hydrogenophaga sp. TaxID=1904254 RepID=UPI002ABD0A40|nr:exonuclease domain-containing protein [Hydrogenophaga sp.]MDZ4176541.1 exonuclease domain-containing protein [Hydrogenophaga sp.]
MKALAHRRVEIGEVEHVDGRLHVGERGAAENRALADVISGFAEQRARLRADITQQVREASRSVEQERSRLAALMSELTQSVVVCNLDGRILLYNNRARMQFKALSAAPALSDGAELIGIGRSIYAAFDKQLVAHALESIEQRMKKGAAHPSAQFVTTSRAGQLLRVQMAPVRGLANSEGQESLGGFVLMLENITRAFQEESALDSMIHTLTERSRASLANMRAAIEMLEFPDLDAPMRERFQHVIRDEVNAMGERISHLVQTTSADIKTRWPLEDMLGADLLDAAQRRIQPLIKVPIAAADIVSNVWLKLDSFSILQMLSYLTERLADEFEVKYVQFRLGERDGRGQLDLVWSGQTMSTETVMTWEMDPMRVGTEATPLTVRDVVARHGGEMWFERDRVRHQAFFRFLLPLAEAREVVEAQRLMPTDSRPEYYDFDLFSVSEQGQHLDDMKLADLAYTVFDTETTGLNPSEGDEIIQMGAARIVNGRLLRQESFDQLVDPRRPIPAHTIPIHGITPEMVHGKPHIGEVLPAFHAFAHDTVLVAHNAAFDMKFLALKEQATGLRFDHPVLDTLLLSAVVHPQQESHRLEAIAERFDITVLGRHTALGDALVTAEVFLRLIPLLADQGIHTLRQAREAAQKTYYARLKY